MAAVPIETSIEEWIIRDLESYEALHPSGSFFVRYREGVPIGTGGKNTKPRPPGLHPLVNAPLCPRCIAELAREDQGRMLTCPKCGGRWPFHEYRRIIRELLVTAKR